MRASTWTGPSSDVDGFNLESEPNVVPSIEARSVATPEPQAFDENGKPRSGSGAVRKRTITDQLQQAIDTGHPPKFCMNCGSVSPPTWRPYWIRTEYGSGEDVKTGEGTGIHCIEPVSKDDEGKTLTYRIYKQWANLSPEEKESQMFEQLILCNSCGDFFKKRKIHRPDSLWANGPKPKGRKKKRSKSGQDATPAPDILDPAHLGNHLENALRQIVSQQALETANRVEAITISAGNQPQGDSRSITATLTRDISTTSIMGPPALPNHVVEDPLFGDESDDMLALQRAIQQSPARNVGSKNSPIEIDPNLESPSTIRRNLFPSPRKDGEFRGLDDMPTKSNTPTNANPRPNNMPVDSSPCPASSDKVLLPRDSIVNLVFTELDKENCPPEDEYSRQLDADLQELLKTPKKTQSRDPQLNPLATPKPAESSPLPGHNSLTPVHDLSQFLNTDSWTPSKLTLSPSWLRNLRTPGRDKNAVGGAAEQFQFGDDFFANLSSDMPLSSSPGLGVSAFASWEFYEDGTATTTTTQGLNEGA